MAQLSLTSNTRHRACVMFRGLINNSPLSHRMFSAVSGGNTGFLHFLQLSLKSSILRGVRLLRRDGLLRSDMVTTERYSYYGEICYYGDTLKHFTTVPQAEYTTTS